MTRKRYVASTDYGTRKSELDKEEMQLGNQVITLYRRPDAKQSSWFFRIHIKEEKRHYRQSLRTNDLNQAKFLAQDHAIKIMAKVLSGQRVLDLSLKDLHSKYQVHMDAEVRKEQISYNTWKSHRYRLKLGLEFLTTKYPKSMDTRLSHLDGEKFRDYLDWRIAGTETKGKTIRRDVVRDELLTIRKMFLWAQKEKLCSSKTIPNWDFKVESESPKRERMPAGSRHAFMNVLTNWALTDSANVPDPKTRYHRLLTMHVIDLVEASGMRSGEVFGLKNKNVRKTGEIEYVIHIDAKTSKVRRERDITVKSFALDCWLSGLQKHNDANDFVFAPFDKGKVSCRDAFYHAYRSLRLKLKEVGLEWFDLYHFRHSWVTNRLMAGEPIHKVAKAGGTSVREVESTYSHILTAEITKEFNKKAVIHFADGSQEIVDVPETLDQAFEEWFERNGKSKRKPTKRIAKS
jgi:integrase